MTTSPRVENRTTAPLSISDVPGPEGKPIVGNMLDGPPRVIDQSNTDQNDHGDNIANEFFPLGCVKLSPTDCP